MRDDFAVFILSHGRADKVRTINTLTRCGYTGKWYIVCDDEDSQIPQYQETFGKENILIFSKKDVEFDIMDNFGGNKVIVFARNVIHDFAKQLGLTYFWELEDDYHEFTYRPIQYNAEKGRNELAYYVIKDLDKVIDSFLKFLDTTGALCVAMAQAGDLLGGANGDAKKMPIKRKVMNTLFCRVDKPFKFVGRMNDDVNTYLSLGKVGELFFHITNTAVVQDETQKTKSGNTVSYLKFGTYVKSFYSVMIHPSACKIKMMRSNHPRIHHKINWEHAVPKIISGRYKKL